MTELNAKGVDDVYIEYYNTGKHDLAQVYIKSEADQHIAELKKEIDRCHKYHDEQAVKWLAENQKIKDAQHWRKFSEETPKHHQYILVFCPHITEAMKMPKTRVRRWDDACKFDVEEFSLYSHWMPLPEEPNDNFKEAK